MLLLTATLALAQQVQLVETPAGPANLLVAATGGLPVASAAPDVKAITACFRGKLPDSTMVSYTIAPDGSKPLPRVDVFPEAQNLEDGCLIAAVHGMKFPSAAEPTLVTILVQPPGVEPIGATGGLVGSGGNDWGGEAVRIAPGVSMADPIILGALDKAKIDAVFTKNGTELAACYARTRETTPDFKGSVTIKFQIVKTGKVGSSTVKKASGNEGLDTCVAAAIGGWTFPKIPTDLVIASYPLTFAPE